jgi:hypothetical protein
MKVQGQHAKFAQRKTPAKLPGFFTRRYGRGLATESNTVCNIVDHVAVQADISEFAGVKTTQCRLGLVLNAQRAEESKNLRYNHIITCFKPAV